VTDAWVEVTTDTVFWAQLALDAARFDVDIDEPIVVPSSPAELMDEALAVRCDSL